MRIALAVLICVSMSAKTFAQTLHTDEGDLHWEGGLDGGLNRDGWQCHGFAAYFPNQYLGLKLSLGAAGEVRALEDWGEEEWNTGHYYADRFRFGTSVVLRSPAVIKWRSKETDIHIFAEPGCILSPGAHESRNPRIFCVEFKTGLNLRLYRAVISLGYSVSNFNLYSGNPLSRYGMPDDDCDRLTHTVFAAVSCKF